MATFPTPNVSGEQTTKQTVRANNFGGSNVWWSNPNPNPALLVNAIASGLSPNQALFRLALSGTNAQSPLQFTISGSQFVASGLTQGTTITNFVNNLNVATPANWQIICWSKNTDTLGATSTNSIVGPVLTDFILQAPTGTTIGSIALYSGTSGTALTYGGLTQVSVTNTAASGAYPTYYNAPNGLPSWVDDAVVHAYPIYGFGNTTQDTTKTEVKQVRQIQTAPSETQQLGNYFVAYQSNLNQNKQKNTKQQQC